MVENVKEGKWKQQLPRFYPVNLWVLLQVLVCFIFRRFCLLYQIALLMSLIINRITTLRDTFQKQSFRDVLKNFAKRVSDTGVFL